MSERPMRRRSDHGIGHGPGQGVDYAGNPVIDPTENVKALTEAAVERIDDMANLRGILLDEKIRRMEREWIHLDELGRLREQHNREMRESESKRVDANRATDLAGVGTAAQAATTGIQALAKQTTDLAATLEKKVTDTAIAAETRYSASYSETNKRLSALEVTLQGVVKQLLAALPWTYRLDDVRVGGGDGVVATAINAGAVDQGTAWSVGAAFLARANALLYTATVEVIDPAAVPGQTVSINFPAPIGRADIKIQSIAITGFEKGVPHFTTITAASEVFTINDLLKQGA